MKTIYVRRLFSYLVPASGADEEDLRSLPSDTILQVKVGGGRSLKQLKLYKSLCRKVSDALEAMGAEYASPKHIDDRYRMVTGHYEAVPLPLPLQQVTGQKVGVITRSIAIEAMDQKEFNAFMDKVTAFTLTELLPHIPTGEFKREIEKMLDD